MKTKTYHAVIFASDEHPRYGVLITCNNRPNLPKNTYYVWSITNISKKQVRLGELTAYMKMKFIPKQQTPSLSATSNNKNTIMFNDIFCSLGWLKSIIETEFDYHVGKGTCKQPTNARKMHNYLKNNYNGYGTMYTDIHPRIITKNIMIIKN